MKTFDTNENHFASKIQSMKKKFHAFDTVEIPKGVKNQKTQKAALLRTISKIIDEIDTDDFSISLLIMKAKQ